jgi:activator of HSP90 ATPase
MKDFNYEITINADREEVFAALTTPFQIELWSGYPAVMDANEGTEFSLWDGDICGINLYITPNKKIIQEWFFGETSEKSIVEIQLKVDLNKTRLVLKHTNIPDEDFDDICEGWKDYYLGSMQDFLEIY